MLENIKLFFKTPSYLLFGDIKGILYIANKMMRQFLIMDRRKRKIYSSFVYMEIVKKEYDYGTEKKKNGSGGYM